MRHALSWFFGGLVTMGLTMGEYDPKSSCKVVVVRRDTGEEVLSFAYDSVGAATGHVASLRSRLEVEHVFDLR